MGVLLGHMAKRAGPSFPSSIARDKQGILKEQQRVACENREPHTADVPLSFKREIQDEGACGKS